MDTAKEAIRLEIKFDIKPVACGRPRFTRFSVTTPKKTADYKTALREILLIQMRDNPDFKDKINYLYDKPLSMLASFHMPIPKRLIRKKDPQPWWTAMHTQKPDVDNIFKAVSDVMSGQVYKDDSQIVHTVIKKIFSERPQVHIIVEECTIDTLAS